MKKNNKQNTSNLEKRLNDIEIEQQNGAKYYTVEELDASLKKIVERKN